GRNVRVTARPVQYRSCDEENHHPRISAPSSLFRMPHPDLAAERARLEFAQSCLDAMRARTAAKFANEDILAANQADAEAVKWQLQRRLSSFDEDAAVLCFGRIDEET